MELNTEEQRSSKLKWIEQIWHQDVLAIKRILAFCDENEHIIGRRWFVSVDKRYDLIYFCCD